MIIGPKVPLEPVDTGNPADREIKKSDPKRMSCRDILVYYFSMILQKSGGSNSDESNIHVEAIQRIM